MFGLAVFCCIVAILCAISINPRLGNTNYVLSIPAFTAAAIIWIGWPNERVLFGLWLINGIGCLLLSKLIAKKGKN